MPTDMHVLCLLGYVFVEVYIIIVYTCGLAL